MSKKRKLTTRRGGGGDNGRLNIKPNALFTADNLYVLNGMNSDCIDLIYLDPPFNSKRLYKAPVGSKAAGAAFEDMWSWKDVDSALMVRLSETHPFLVDYITSIERIHSKAMMAYIAYMAQRLFEMHRVLKPTGSIYLHCDPTASHYLKAMMDRIFGAKNFRNEITWERTSSRSDGKRWGRTSDKLLFYTNSSKYTWHNQYTPLNKGGMKYYAYEDEMLDKFGPYGCSDLTGPGISNGESGDAWKGHNPSDSSRHWAVSLTGAYAEWIEENIIPGFRSIEGVHARLDALNEHGLIHVSSSGRFRMKRYLNASKGAKVNEVFTDIPPTAGNEDTGYPTQKPLALLSRIIEASSNEGDVVLDPFCGCATTCVAAQQLGRQWIGIDISETTEGLIRARLADDVGAVFNDFMHYATLPDRRDVKRMTKREAKPLLYGSQAGHCAGCKEHFEIRHLEVDHDIPKSKGGGDYLDNYQLMCGHCNRTKGNRPMEYLLSVIAKRKAQRRIFGATLNAASN